MRELDCWCSGDSSISNGRSPLGRTEDSLVGGGTPDVIGVEDSGKIFSKDRTSGKGMFSGLSTTEMALL